MRAWRPFAPLLVMVVLAQAGTASAQADEPLPADAVTVPSPKLVDLNTATVAELDGLPGVGRKRAEAIIAERAKRPFRRPTELLRIKGIGPKMFARLRPFVAVAGKGGVPEQAGAP